jgi:hypothetical protein
VVNSQRIESLSDFTDKFSTIEEPELTAEQMVELWDIWEDFRRNWETQSTTYLVAVPQWYMLEEIGIRRPFLFAETEYDNFSKDAVLWGNAQLIDISIVENAVFDQVSLEETVEELDVSADNDYIDESGKMWIPRKLMTTFRRDSS